MIRVESVIVRDTVRAGVPTGLLIVGTQPLAQLVEFFREKSFSLSAERSYVQAVGRFIEWLSVRAAEFSAPESRRLLYTAFVHDLRFGTYRDDEYLYGLIWGAISQKNLK